MGERGEPRSDPRQGSATSAQKLTFPRCSDFHGPMRGKKDCALPRTTARFKLKVVDQLQALIDSGTPESVGAKVLMCSMYSPVHKSWLHFVVRLTSSCGGH